MSKKIRVIALMEASTVTGPAKNLLRFCRLARERSGGCCEVSIVTFVRAADSSAPLDNGFTNATRAAGIEIDVIRERYRFDLQVLPQLRHVIDERAPDIIQTHGIKSHFLARKCRGRQSRWLAYHHGYTAEDLKMHVYNQLNRWLLPSSDRVVTVCGAFAEALVRSGVQRDRITVLPNSIDPESLRSSEEDDAGMTQRAVIRERVRILLSVGRLSREKGHRHLIEAMRQMKQRQPQIPMQLLLIGEGPERTNLENQVAAAGLRDEVSMLGHLRDPLTYYRRADVFILPSESEGSPNVLLEAMAAGAPVVASAVGGVPETVRDQESALLVPAGNPAALAEATLRILNDPELAQRLRENALQAVRTRHAPEAYCDALLNVYARLLGGDDMPAR